MSKCQEPSPLDVKTAIGSTIIVLVIVPCALIRDEYWTLMSDNGSDGKDRSGFRIFLLNIRFLVVYFFFLNAFSTKGRMWRTDSLGMVRAMLYWRSFQPLFVRVSTPEPRVSQ